MRRMLGISLAGLLLLGACGDDDTDDAATTTTEEEPDEVPVTDHTAQDYIDAVVASIQEDTGIEMEEAQATCIATAMVEVIGVEALHEAEVTPEDMEQADDVASLGIETSESMVADLATDLRACDAGAAIKMALIGGYSEQLAVSPEGATCLTDNIDDDAVVDATAQLFVDSAAEGDLQGLLESALAACPGALAEVVVGVFESQLGAEIPADGRSCIADQVNQRPQEVAASLGSDDPAGFDNLAQELAQACPQAFGGGSG